MASHSALKAALLAWAAFAASLIGASPANAADTRTPIPPPAKDFAQAAVQSDQYEILAAEVAITQSKTTQVTDFAQSMIDAHRQTQRDLVKAATTAGLPLPDLAMGSDQAALLAALQGLRGADFDKAYARQQVLAHTQALAVERSYADLGREPNLQAAAKSAMPLIERHLEMARQLSTAIGAD